MSPVVQSNLAMSSERRDRRENDIESGETRPIPAGRPYRPPGRPITIGNGRQGMSMMASDEWSLR